MGRYLNPGNEAFATARSGEYVDKTGLVSLFSRTLNARGNLYCVSRPRRFGKSMAARMLAAYYGKGCDSRALFEGLDISRDDSFETHLNRHNILYLDMSSVLVQCADLQEVVPFIMRSVNRELKEAFRMDIDTDIHLTEALLRTGEKFIFIIDEWDAICREAKEDEQAFDTYVNLLRGLFKGDVTERVFEGVYLTGILPIKKYGTQSALNNFDEYTMLMPGKLAPYFGFTEEEVKTLCMRHHLSFSEMKRWYDGYSLGKAGAVYNPNSVMKAISYEAFDNYWAATASYESIKDYISMNFDGLKDSVIAMLGGLPVTVNPTKFQNDLVNLRGRDAVLTLLVHLGYLGYHPSDGTVYIPNYEISVELQNAVEDTGWERVQEALTRSMLLLEQTLSGNEGAVAAALESIHAESTSILQYNDENSLSCAISLAYYSARKYYTIIREFPAGKGFADLVFLPVPGSGKPPMVVELKYNRDIRGAIGQIKARKYPESLRGLSEDILLVGINYDKTTKRHQCHIEKHTFRQ